MRVDNDSPLHIWSKNARMIILLNRLIWVKGKKGSRADQAKVNKIACLSYLASLLFNTVTQGLMYLHRKVG